ncbi:MAG: tripartite tricarboxylate transporter TctB family protein [Phreatobacter sp.]|jgi:putative tricarboxylic transport membrane protein|uniref:tripartite tricarboxylate transporter TctB family protein n=1 Tax=Phreatobacter sp. TaxID=1966341 RepID=UPI004036F059
MRRLINSEVASGLLVVAFGVLGLSAIGSLDIGTANDMGPGYLPRLVAWALVVAGLAMTGLAVLRTHPPIPDLHLRPLVAISAAVLFFGASIDRYGMVIAVVGMTLLAGLASPISRWRETPLIAGCLAAGAVLVFIVGLKLAIPIWPR